MPSSKKDISKDICAAVQKGDRKKIADLLQGREFVARHPRTGLWHGMDRVLRCPLTDGFKNKSDAKRAWRDVSASQIGDVMTQKVCLRGI